MYTATIDSVRLTFQASGSLWQDALVMQDLKTKSLWSQVTGEAIDGDLKNNVLTLFYSSFMTFTEFKNKYPHGQLLKKPELGNAASHYNKYFESDTTYGIFGHQYQFDRISQKEIVYGLRLKTKNVALTQNYLTKNNSVTIKDGDESVNVYFDSTSQIVSATRQPLSVRKGSSAAKLLTEPVPVVTAFWFAWVSFFSDTELIHE